VPQARRDERADENKVSEDWILAFSAVTHAPVDLAAEVGLELPMGLRFGASYGYVPSAYLNVITGALTSANAVDETSRALVEKGFESGRSWRLQLGLRPFKSFGGYIDAGFSRVTISGTLAAADAMSAGLLLPVDYSVDSTLNLWFVELGYQAQIANRLLLAFGFGLMRTTSAKTTAESVASSVPIVGQTEDQVTSNIDSALEQYGIIPTLNLRIGFDAI
jgi:hypothetical protein